MAQTRTHIFQDDGYIPRPGEIVVVRLSKDLAGPGSVLNSVRNLPSRATSRNYHHAVVLNIHINESAIAFDVFPIPSYSAVDENGLTSTAWLLNEPMHIQQLHVPLPHQISTTSPSQPPFPTPAAFGEPLYVGGWEDRRPSWVVVAQQVANLKPTTKFKAYDPPVRMTREDISRLRAYSRQLTITQTAGVDGGRAPTGRNSKLQDIDAVDAIHDGLSMTTLGSSLCDLDDDDEDWKNTTDPVTFMRDMAAGTPHPIITKFLEDHDREERMRLESKISSWATGITDAAERCAF